MPPCHLHVDGSILCARSQNLLIIRRHRMPAIFSLVSIIFRRRFHQHHLSLSPPSRAICASARSLPFCHRIFCSMIRLMMPNTMFDIILGFFIALHRHACHTGSGFRSSLFRTPFGEFISYCKWVPRYSSFRHRSMFSIEAFNVNIQNSFRSSHFILA